MPDQYRPITSSLRSRLLILTVVFLSAFEALIYFPAIATFRQNFLEEKLVAAQIAALSLVEASQELSPQLEDELLATAGVVSIIIRRQNRSLMLGFDRAPLEVDAEFDLRKASLADMIKDALETLDADGKRLVRVVGEPGRADTRYVEISLDEAALYESMSAFSNNMLLLSLVVAVFSGILVYLALHWMVVRPMNRLKTTITDFRRDPERWEQPLKTSRRSDEIGVIDRELVRMQAEIKQSLKQKTRLAELGEAVAKINHDLRNILATAQLASDALSRVDHPHVQKISGRLMRTVSRAVALCERTLKHGKADEPEPLKAPTNVKAMVLDVASTLGLTDAKDFSLTLEVGDEATALVDEEQFHRVLMNLCRNAFDAQKGTGGLRVCFKDDADAGRVELRIRDYGPGIPNHLITDLFKPFRTSNGKNGGTGLGLSIARDIVTAHGGHLALEETGPEGTTFVICLPK